MDHERQISSDFRVGPATPLGEGLRRYWIPACLSEELPTPGCDPIRLRLLGEDFVAFRDDRGRIGVLDEACPHRLASLVLGRNEGDGLRCLWHQWKFDVTGELLDSPNAPNCNLKDRVRANSYAAQESGGIVWVFLGAAELAPPLPRFGWAIVPDEHRKIVPLDLDCSFVKALEALTDSSHVSLLHVDSIRKSAIFRSTISDGSVESVDSAPKLEWMPTSFGFYYASLREAAQQTKKQVRITAYAAPYACFVAPAGSAFIASPQDDDHCRFFNIKWLPRVPMTGQFLSRWIDFMGLSPEVLDRYGLRPLGVEQGPMRARNRLVQDREAMRSGLSHSGFTGLNSEDAALICSIPKHQGRASEHLVPADLGVVKLRHVFARIARNTGDDQPLPYQIDASMFEAIDSISGLVDVAEDWRSLLPQPAGNALNMPLTH